MTAASVRISVPQCLSVQPLCVSSLFELDRTEGVLIKNSHRIRSCKGNRFASWRFSARNIPAKQSLRGTWAGAGRPITFVDFDRGLNAAMVKLHSQALGRLADNPRFIERRRPGGISIRIAPLLQAGQDRSGSGPGSIPIAPHRTQPQGWVATTALCPCLLLIGSDALLRSASRQGGRAESDSSAPPVPLTAVPGLSMGCGPLFA